MIVLFFVLGAIISILSGFFGVGGGFILTPILLLIGFAPVEAITTSLLYTVGTSISGFIAHTRLKNILWKQGVLLGLSGMVATQVARPFVFFMKQQGLDVVVIPLLYILLLSYFAFKMLRRRGQSTGEEVVLTFATAWPRLIVIGFIGGFISTTMGVGGGFIIVPLSIAFLKFPPKKAVGTSLFAVLMIVSVGFISYAVSTPINYKIGLLLVAGGLLGSQFGAKLTTYFKQVEITTLLSGLYVSTALSVALKLVHLNKIGLSLVGLFVFIFLMRAVMKIKKGKLDVA